MSQPHPSSPFKPSERRSARSLLAAISIAAGVLFAPAAQAGIVTNPGSIVDHGEYITDTVNHLDWYKFSNFVTTVGYSRDDWMSSFGGSGWSIANVAQVQGLEGQFGYVADTFDFGNANYGLTEVMAAYLGHTSIISFFDGQTNLTTYRIEAMTSENYFFWNDATQAFDDERVLVTLSQWNSFEDAHHQFYYTGDFVDSGNSFQRVGEADQTIGIWLTRASTDEGGGGVVGDCGRTAPCPSVDVPEPSSGALLMFGLVVLGTLRRTRYATLPRK